MLVRDETSVSRRQLASVVDETSRTLQLSPNATVNQVVGIVTVSVNAEVTRQEDRDLPAHCDYDHEITSWWKDLDSSDKFRLFGIVVGSLLGYCCPLLICFLCLRRRDEEKEIIEVDGDQNVKVNVNVNNESETKKIEKSSSLRSINTVDFSESRDLSKENDHDDGGPRKKDVCFEDLSHPGTKKLIKVIKSYQKHTPDTMFGQSAYRIIQKDISDARYFSLDKNGRYVEVSKKKSIPLMGVLYEQIQGGRLPRSKSNRSLEDMEGATRRRSSSKTISKSSSHSSLLR